MLLAQKLAFRSISQAGYKVCPLLVAYLNMPLAIEAPSKTPVDRALTTQTSQ